MALSKSLQKKEDFALHLIESAARLAELHKEVIEVAYSGGKDSDVLLHLVQKTGIPYKAIYKNTTIDPPGTIAHVRSKGVTVVQPKMTFAQIIEKKGLPHRYRRFCCSILKEYKIGNYVLLGIRRDESKKRFNLYKEPEKCRAYPHKVEVHQFYPILYFNKSDLKEYIEHEKIICHALYYDDNNVFHPERRLGCMCCPLASLENRKAQFIKYPNMVKFYLKKLERFWNEFPQRKIVKEWQSPERYFVNNVFFKTRRDFMYFESANLFDDNFDYKQFIQNYFKIKL